MTDDVRNLIRFVVDGDIRNAQTQCRIMLEKNVPEKDARFKEAELKKLNLLKPELIQLPAGKSLDCGGRYKFPGKPVPAPRGGRNSHQQALGHQKSSFSHQGAWHPLYLLFAFDGPSWCW